MPISQRDYMRTLVRKHGRKEEVVVAAFAKAERSGEVVRRSNNSDITPEAYARALWADGVRKGWL